MHEYGTTVVIQINSSGTATALSMKHMTSLTLIVLAHFVTNIAFALSLNSHVQIKTERDGHLTTRFEF